MFLVDFEFKMVQNMCVCDHNQYLIYMSQYLKG